MMRHLMIQDGDLALNAKVMLIDNSSVDNYINEKILRIYEFAKEVIVFKQSTKALLHLQNLQHIGAISDLPEFIFLDLSMPVMNGFEFLENFEKLSLLAKSNIKIIVLSNTMDPLKMELSIKNPNVLAFINKPLIKTNMIEIVKAISYSKAG